MSDPREPWQSRQTGDEKLDEMAAEMEEIAKPQPWTTTPDEMQPVAKLWLEAHRLNKLSQEGRTDER